MRLGELPPLHIVGRGIMAHTGCADDLDVGIALLDGLAYHEESLFESRRHLVLVAYTYIIKVMMAARPVDELQYLITVGGHIPHVDSPLLSGIARGVGHRTLAGHTRSHHWQRLTAQVVAELEELLETRVSSLCS